MSLEDDLKARARASIDATFAATVEAVAQRLTLRVIEERPVIMDLLGLYVETALRKALDDLGVHPNGKDSPS